MHKWRTLEAEPALLALVCAYELGGLLGWWPTITNLSMRLGRHLRFVEASLAYLWLLRHFEVWKGRV